MTNSTASTKGTTHRQNLIAGLLLIPSLIFWVFVLLLLLDISGPFDLVITNLHPNQLRLSVAVALIYGFPLGSLILNLPSLLDKEARATNKSGFGLTLASLILLLLALAATFINA